MNKDEDDLWIEWFMIGEGCDKRVLMLGYLTNQLVVSLVTLIILVLLITHVHTFLIPYPFHIKDLMNIRFLETNIPH